MNDNTKAKYLNTPETPIFRKGHLLYGYHLAKESARAAGTVIVTEGCVDVIACARAGLGHAVAPLGTAITAEQIKALWSLSDCSIVALDGDSAGIRAGRRMVDVAFPLMTLGKSLRFALLPRGSDPDDIVNREKASGLTERLGRAVPLMDFLWRVETRMAPNDERQMLKTPEGQAALRSRLGALIKTVPDRDIRTALFKDLGRRWQETFYPGGKRRTTAPGGTLVAPRPLGEVDLLAPVIARPKLLDEIYEEFEALAFSDADLESCRRAIVSWYVERFGDSETDDCDAGPSLFDHLAMSPHMGILGEIAVSPVYRSCKVEGPDAVSDDDTLDAWRRRCQKIAVYSERRSAARALQDALSRGDEDDIAQCCAALKRAEAVRRQEASAQ